MKLEKLSENKQVFLILAFIVILGFALRIYHLGVPSLWCDELNTKYRIRCQPPQIIADLRHYPFPPLYYILMHYWGKFSGDSEFSLRFPSLIFSVLAIIFIFILAKELFGKKVGLFSALFASISPFSIYYAQEAKMYSLLWLCGVLSFLFFYRFNKDNKTTDLLLYILFTLFTIYTMYIGFIFMIIQNIAFFSFPHTKRTKHWLLGQLAILLLYLPWSGMFLYHIIHKTGTEWIPKVSHYPQLLFKVIFPRTICGVITRNNALELGIYFFLIITAFVNITKTGQKRYTPDFKRTDYLLLLWIIVPILIYWLINTFICPLLCEETERYIGFIYIPLFILISKGLNKYSAKIKSVILTFLLLVTFTSQVFPLYTYNYRVNRDDYREFQHQIKLRADTNSLILTDLPIFAVGYYNKDCKIRPLGYIDILEQQTVNKLPPSIFLIYRTPSPKDSSSFQDKLKRYKLMENYFKYPNGFFWFKKLK